MFRNTARSPVAQGRSVEQILEVTQRLLYKQSPDQGEVPQGVRFARPSEV
ncbi:MAG: hypothetical protein ACFB0G_21510 [Leptolyngbyaceae cyanobacterium]